LIQHGNPAHKSASVKYLSRGGGFEFNALFIEIYQWSNTTKRQCPRRSRRNVKHVKRWTVTSAAALFVAAILVGPTSSIADSNISPSDVQQGIASSPIPFDKLNLQNRPRALVALGSYLVNGVGDCVGCHTFPRFLRPGGTVSGTNGNFTGNVTGMGSDRTSGNPFLDGPEQSVTGQMKAKSTRTRTVSSPTRRPGFRSTRTTISLPAAAASVFSCRAI
jgi:hypothetical protein